MCSSTCDISCEAMTGSTPRGESITALFSTATPRSPPPPIRR
ncbi:hypothetical protein N599_31625 [Saccharopolyspora erythraea D]|nr:hypothetical protein N599_31625 [Saccharopolyspora erythraea D]